MNFYFVVGLFNLSSLFSYFSNPIEFSYHVRFVSSEANNHEVTILRKMTYLILVKTYLNKEVTKITINRN